MRHEVKRIVKNIRDAEQRGHDAYGELILKFLSPKLRAAVKRALQRG